MPSLPCYVAGSKGDIGSICNLGGGGARCFEGQFSLSTLLVAYVAHIRVSRLAAVAYGCGGARGRATGNFCKILFISYKFAFINLHAT